MLPYWHSPAESSQSATYDVAVAAAEARNFNQAAVAQEAEDKAAGERAEEVATAVESATEQLAAKVTHEVSTQNVAVESAAVAAAAALENKEEGEEWVEAHKLATDAKMATDDSAGEHNKITPALPGCSRRPKIGRTADPA